MSRQYHIATLLAGITLMLVVSYLGYRMSLSVAPQWVDIMSGIAVGCGLVILLLQNQPRALAVVFLFFAFLQGLLLPHLLILPWREAILLPSLVGIGGLLLLITALAALTQPHWINQQKNLGLFGLVLTLGGFFWVFPQANFVALLWGIITIVVFCALLYITCGQFFANPDLPYMNTVRAIYLQSLGLFWVMIRLQLITHQLNGG